ncbi:MAG: hypothetical protein SRB2_04643 [Desulfobacteraceae bacterium Eth-SRB2]|nr:MAG: hypothetical protein SRB2_04643 [Desulfobacteraceae bacterium Eth-SRB2]
MDLGMVFNELSIDLCKKMSKKHGNGWSYFYQYTRSASVAGVNFVF